MLKNFFLWCMLINFGVLLFWLSFIVFARDWVYRFHGQWFKNLSQSQFDALHYGMMGAYKLAVYIFVVVPFIALHIIS